MTDIMVLGRGIHTWFNSSRLEKCEHEIQGKVVQSNLSYTVNFIYIKCSKYTTVKHTVNDAELQTSKEQRCVIIYKDV